MKNKKGNKQQQFIAQVQKQVQSGGNPIRRKDEEARIAEKKAKEAAKKKEDEEKRLLNKVVVVQKVDQGKYDNHYAMQGTMKFLNANDFNWYFCYFRCRSEVRFLCFFQARFM